MLRLARKPAATNAVAPVPTPVTAPVFDFDSATMAEKVVFLSNAGHHQTAVEHFLAMTEAERMPALANGDFRNAYDTSIKSFVRLSDWEKYRGPVSVDAFSGLSDAESVRAHWGGDFFYNVIRIYERSSGPDTCKTDSRATAAYLDAKLRKTGYIEYIRLDFENATPYQKLALLNYIGHDQAAVELYLSLPAEERPYRAVNSWPAYEDSLRKYVAFTPAAGAKWEDFSEAEKVRAFHQSDKCEDAIAVYEASAECKTDSKATAAYLDCKLRAADKAKEAAVDAKLKSMTLEEYQGWA